jgi:hypothetical protein
MGSELTATPEVPLVMKFSAEREAFASEICAEVESRADESWLPRYFMARLIWQESAFDPLAVSPAGAQGIAQFMPGTARDRGLENPFDPVSALAASAAYLAELRGTFGNLGLAAAAYNAGEQRVRDWLAGNADLPPETQNYVRTITGRNSVEWKEADADFPIPSISDSGAFPDQCRRLVLGQLTLRTGTQRASVDSDETTEKINDPHNGRMPNGLQFGRYPSDIQEGLARAPRFDDRDQAYRIHKSQIVKAMRRGPNLAGHFTVLVVSCGDNCSKILFADRLTGRIRELPVPEGNVSYSSDARSRLLLVSKWNHAEERCEVIAYLWEKFSPLPQLGIHHSNEAVCARGTTPKDLRGLTSN